MPRPDVNRSSEMEVFVQVFDRGAFSAAARAMGITPSAVSKLVARLESRLGTQLVRRSTRRLQLTAEGEDFYERSVRVLADISEAERSVAAGAAPRGRVSVNTSVAFGMHILVPLVRQLRTLHPQVTLDITLTDSIVDLLEERTDIAIRWGALSASDLVARRLGETVQCIVASPGYLERHGTPRKPEDLESHQHLDFTYRRRIPDWPFVVRGQTLYVPVRADVRASDGETLRQLALAGAGIARLSRYHIHGDLKGGRLTPVLEKYNAIERVPIHAVYLGKPGRLPSRVRAVLDFLDAQLRADPRFEDHTP